MWPNPTLDQVAVHEAGHAVARVLLEIPFSHVELLSTNDARVVSGTEAKAEWLPTLPDDYTVSDAMATTFDRSNEQTLMNYLISTAAGPVAQMEYEGYEVQRTLEPFPSFGGPGDAGTIHRNCLILAALDETTVRGVIERKDDRVAAVIESARHLVVEHQEWIRLVAAELERCRILHRTAVEDMRP